MLRAILFSSWCSILDGVRISEVFYSFRRKAVIYRRISRSQVLTKMRCASCTEHLENLQAPLKTDRRNLAFPQNGCTGANFCDNLLTSSLLFNHFALWSLLYWKRRNQQQSFTCSAVPDLAAWSVNKEFLPYTIFRSNKGQHGKDQMLGKCMASGMPKF